VVETLKHEGATVIRVTMQVVQRCHKQHLETGSVVRQKGSGRLTFQIEIAQSKYKEATQKLYR